MPQFSLAFRMLSGSGRTFLTIPQIPPRPGAPVAVTAHEAGCGPIKSHDLVRIYMNCNIVRNC
jgi:hypothetical protein